MFLLLWLNDPLSLLHHATVVVSVAKTSMFSPLCSYTVKYKFEELTTQSMFNRIDFVRDSMSLHLERLALLIMKESQCLRNTKCRLNQQYPSVSFRMEPGLFEVSSRHQELRNCSVCQPRPPHQCRGALKLGIESALGYSTPIEVCSPRELGKSERSLMLSLNHRELRGQNGVSSGDAITDTQNTNMDDKMIQ